MTTGPVPAPVTATAPAAQVSAPALLLGLPSSAGPATVTTVERTSTP